MPDFNLGEAFQNDPEFNQKLSSVVGDSIGHIGESVKQKQQQDAAQKTEFTWNSKDNTVTGTMDADYMKTIASDLKAYHGIRGEYDKMLQQNAQQQANIKAHPFANTLAQIAASIASQDTNPLTRGIGMAAGKLNPTTQDLQKQQMGLLGQKEKALASETNAVEKMATIRAAQEYRKTMASQRDAALTQKGEIAGGKLGLEEKKLDYKKESDEKKAAAKVTEQAAREKLIAVKTDSAMKLREKEHALRQADIGYRYDRAEGLQKTMAEYKENLHTDTQFNKVPPKQMDRLVDIGGIKKYTTEVRQLLDSPEMAGYVGPLQPERILPRFAQSPNRVKVEEFLAQELPRINSVIKGGVRMVSSPEGRKFIQDNLGFKANMPVESIKKILDNVDSIVGNEQESIIEAHKSAPWDRVPELLGDRYDYAMKLHAGASAAPGGLKGVSAPVKGGAGTAPPKGQRYFDSATGKWVNG